MVNFLLTMILVFQLILLAILTIGSKSIKKGAEILRKEIDLRSKYRKQLEQLQKEERLNDR